MNDIKGIIEDVEKSDLVSNKVIKKVIEIIGKEEWNDIYDEEDDICTTTGELIITLKGIAELEKENAELKNQLSDVYECFISASSGDDFEMAESAREVMEVLNMQCYRHGEVKSKLTKAKEIIKQYLYCYSQKELPSKLQIEAEQFLKENE